MVDGRTHAFTMRYWQRDNTLLVEHCYWQRDNTLLVEHCYCATRQHSASRTLNAVECNQKQIAHNHCFSV